MFVVDIGARIFRTSLKQMRPNKKWLSTKCEVNEFIPQAYFKFGSSPRINRIIKSFDSLSSSKRFLSLILLLENFFFRPIDLQENEIFE